MIAFRSFVYQLEEAQEDNRVKDSMVASLKLRVRLDFFLKHQHYNIYTRKFCRIIFCFGCH